MHTVIEDVCFNCDDIIKVIQNLKNTMSHGPDIISCFLVKKLASSIFLPLSLLFQFSLHEEILSDLWKVACIVPIYKDKESQYDVINYRPLSLASVICKLMKSIIKLIITQRCFKNNLMSVAQHGFVHGKSTVTNLWELTNDIWKKLDSGNNVNSLCIDFAKAFDTVPHK